MTQGKRKKIGLLKEILQDKRLLTWIWIYLYKYVWQNLYLYYINIAIYKKYQGIFILWFMQYICIKTFDGTGWYLENLLHGNQSLYVETDGHTQIKTQQHKKTDHKEYYSKNYPITLQLNDQAQLSTDDRNMVKAFVQTRIKIWMRKKT